MRAVADVARALLAVAVLLLSAGPAAAEWRRVETDKFVVYGQGGEKAVRDFALKLTTFDWMLRLLHPSTKDRQPYTKVQVYLVSGQDDLKRVQPRLQRYTRGFYTAMNEGVFAFAIRDGALGADDVLFHEYAHHFMLENFPAAYPAWFVEGWAEYFMTTEITDELIKIGGYSEARAYGIFGQTWIPLEELLSKTTGETRPERRNVYYAQAWLLTHYMSSDAKRAAQLHTAITAIADGKDPVKSFEAATGMTVSELTAALKRYRKLPGIGIKNPKLAPPTTVTVLPESADDLLLDNLRLILAPTGQVDAGFLAGVRRKAARHPNDAFAQQVLARAEFVMGDIAAGEAIMKRRLEAEPQGKEDLLLAGMGQIMAGLRDRPNREARYRAARPLLAKAYAQDKEDFRTLYAYAFSRTVEPQFPTDNDLKALLEARALAPSVQENAFRAGMALLQKGRREEAARVLAPVLNSPHGGQAAARARALLNQGRPGTMDLTEPQKDEPDAPEPAPPPPATPAK